MAGKYPDGRPKPGRKKTRDYSKTEDYRHIRKNPLKPEHYVFCKEYALNWKVGEAAQKAGIAANSASRLLKDPRIQSEIMKILDSNQLKINVKHNDLLRHLKMWYESDITETIGLSPDEIKKLDPNIRKLITKYKHKKTKGKDGELIETIELEFVSKEKAMEMVARHIGFFREDNIQNQTNIQINNLSDSALNELLSASQ